MAAVLVYVWAPPGRSGKITPMVILALVARTHSEGISNRRVLGQSHQPGIKVEPAGIIPLDQVIFQART